MTNDKLDLNVFNQKFQAAQEYLEQMLSQVNGDFVPSELLARTLQELSTSVEELHVISEEVYEQQEQLFVAKETIEKQRQQQYFQELFESVSDGYLATDVKGVIQEVNHTATVLLNVRREWLIDKPMAVLILQADHQNFYTLLARLQQGEQVQDVELRLQPREKPFLYGAFKILVVRNDENQIIAFRWLFQDITQLRLSEAARQAAENDLQTAKMENLRLVEVVNSASDGIFVTDPNQPDHPIIYVNSAFSQITGYEPDEVIGRNIDFLLGKLQGTATDRQTIVQIRQAIVAQKEFKDVILDYRKDGEPFWNEFKISPVFSERGDLIYFVANQTDVTQRKLSEAKIREQAALLDIVNDAIIVQNLNNQVVFWNQGAERLYGWKAEEALGKNINKLLYKDTLPQSSEFQHSEVQGLEVQGLEVQQALNEQGFWEGELHQVTKNGREISVESQLTFVRDDRRNPASILVVNSDITEKKILQAHLFRAQRLESIGTLASGIAHDINNILTPILAIAQLLPSTITDMSERNQQLLQIVETNAKRGADLVKQMLTFSNIQSSTEKLLSVSDLLGEIQQIIRETFPKLIELQTHIPPKLWSIRGDKTQLYQVLMNLCLNARDAMLDAMANQSKLTISVKNKWIDQNYASMITEAQAGAYVVITISDTGCGMSPEILERIFDPFFTTKEVGQGTGLGLSTVMGILKNHGGFIEVSSQVGQGSQFQVFLPAVPTGEIASEPDVELPRGNGELILVVDDEVGICQTTMTILEKYDYQVLCAGDGIEALGLYTQQMDKISVVLMDMMMPVMDGVITIHTLYKINPQVKIIAISGMVSEDLKSQISPWVKAFLSKPYTTAELLNTLQQVLPHPGLHKFT